MDKEIWVDIKNYDGLYMISNHGRVISFKKGSEHIMSPGTNGRYPRIVLYNGDRQAKAFSIHRLVAEHFIPRGRDDQTEVAHFPDPTYTNCHWQNLVWASHKENMCHMKTQHRNGTPAQRKPRAKLSREAVIDIRTREHNVNHYAKTYAITARTVQRIWQGVIWKNLPKA